MSHWEINKFENCWFKSVRILEVLKFLFQQFLNLSSSQRDMSGPILGDLSNNRWSEGTLIVTYDMSEKWKSGWYIDQYIIIILYSLKILLNLHSLLMVLFQVMTISTTITQGLPPNHLWLDSAPNLGPLISRWEINKFENCWYKSVGIIEVLKILFHQFLNLSSSRRDMSGQILGGVSSNRWSRGINW